MRRIFIGLLSISLFTTLLYLITRSWRLTAPNSQASIVTVTAQARARTEYAQKMAEVIAKSTQDYLSEDPEVLGYRADLLLERATDLILIYNEKIEANELQLTDTASRKPYTSAFPVAVDFMNQVTPPNYMAYPWKQVFKVALQYNLAYTSLIQGKPLTPGDIYNLKTARQILTNYQSMAERNLAQRELGNDFIAYQQQWVDRYLLEKYGSTSMPIQQP